jgi:FAD synthase
LRPTVVKHARFPLLEVHCLSHPPKAVPGSQVRTEMLANLRPERKFAGPGELARAVRRDIKKARRILHQPPPPPFF